jgi:D-alanyl-D-alanine dipeptidase
MPGLVPGIHVLLSSVGNKDVDGRDKPGHDENEMRSPGRYANV